MLGNAVPFFPGKVWKYKPEFFIKWKVSGLECEQQHACVNFW